MYEGLQEGGKGHQGGGKGHQGSGKAFKGAGKAIKGVGRPSKACCFPSFLSFLWLCYDVLLIIFTSIPGRMKDFYPTMALEALHDKEGCET